MKTPGSRRIRLGIIGTGLAARRLHWPALSKMPERFEVAAFSNRTRSTAEEFAAFASLGMDGYNADYQKLLRRDDVEAVLVGVPIPQLLPIARDCLQAGKHVICEKPPGGDLDEGREFVALVRRHPDLVFLMAENFFYRDELRLARSLIDDGRIGEPRLLLERWVDQLVPTPGQFSITPWRYEPQYRGGPVLDAGVHSVAEIRLIGGDVVRVYMRTEWANPTMNAPSAFVATLDFASGAIGNGVWAFLGNPVVDEGNDLRLYGSEGSLIVGRGRVRLVTASGAVESWIFENVDGGFYNEFLNFHEAIVLGAPVVGTVEQSYANMLVVLRALDSSDQHCSMDLDDLPGGPKARAVPLWRPYGADGLFDGLPVVVRRAEPT